MHKIAFLGGLFFLGFIYLFVVQIHADENRVSDEFGSKPRGLEVLLVYVPVEESEEPVWMLFDHDRAEIWPLDDKLVGGHSDERNVSAPILLEKNRDNEFSIRYRGEVKVLRANLPRRPEGVVLIPHPVSGLDEVMDAESELNRERTERLMENIRREAEAAANR